MLIAAGKILQIDAELLALLVEMAPLEAQCAGGLRNVASVALEFGQHRFTLECQNTLRKW